MHYQQGVDAFKYAYDKKNQKPMNLLAKRQARFIKDNFAIKNMEEQLSSYLDKYTSNIPTQVALKLPKLNKIAPTKPEIKLPKLKKVEL